MSRGTKAVLDLSALTDNLKAVRQRAPDSNVLAVVKANAYGHGMEPVVDTLLGVDGFAVATIEEAARVRARAPHHRIVLLEGVISLQDLQQAQQLRLDLVVHSPFQLEMLEQSGAAPATCRVWLKADTGMNRLGFRFEDATAAWQRLHQIKSVDHSEIVLTSHLANADDLSDPKTALQAQRFDELARQLGAEHVSLANSAGVMGWPQTTRGWVRTGLALYGASPLMNRVSSEMGLRPCMSLYTRLIAINHCRRSDAIGYGGIWRCPDEMQVGVIAIGYGDGYPRHAANGTPVRIGSHNCPLIGRVSMDMISVDLRQVPDAKIGDEVQLWGEQLPIEHVARGAETIAYELMCGVTARVPVEYRQSIVHSQKQAVSEC